MIVREGSNISLRCKATGSPTPTVKWKRDDNTKIAINRHINHAGMLKTHPLFLMMSYKLLFNFKFYLKYLFIYLFVYFCLPFSHFPVNEWEGATLDIHKISRLDMGAYLCIASNGVPPSVSKRIKVSVDCEYFLNYIFLN